MKYFFKYNRKASKIYYLPLSDHGTGCKDSVEYREPFDYLYVMQSCPYREILRLKRRKNKICLIMKVVYYYCDYNHNLKKKYPPNRIKKVYVDDHGSFYNTYTKHRKKIYSQY